MVKPALYKPHLNFQNTLSGVESQSTHKHSWSGCLRGGEPTASIKEKSREDTSLTTLDFICPVREALLGISLWPETVEGPFHTLNLFTTRYVLLVQISQMKKVKPTDKKCVLVACTLGLADCNGQTPFTPSCFPYGIKASCQSCKNPAVIA